MTSEPIGQKISPILSVIENALWEFEVNNGCKPEFTEKGFRAATKIFMSALTDKMWELQENEDLTLTDRENMATKAGEAVRNFVKVYTNIDTHDLYK